MKYKKLKKKKLIALSFSHKMFLKIVSKPMPLRHSLTFPFIILYDIQVNTERAIRHAVQDRLPIVVVINKVTLTLSAYLWSINYFIIEQ